MFFKKPEISEEEIEEVIVKFWLGFKLAESPQGNQQIIQMYGSYANPTKLAHAIKEYLDKKEPK